ncbi:ATP-binding protein [Streptomyces sp. NPDC094032]|uniref:ATP-binding protein n=1 Tax=Streptomyces sp. NPDC094032 TaxID=3155308 RepID=UPI00332CE0EC
MTAVARGERLPYRHVLSLPVMGSAVRMVRETAELVLVECGVGLAHPSVGPALLVLSELATNTVRHAAEASQTFTVIFAHGPNTLAFAVHDHHPYQPAVYQALATAPGSGLALVARTVMELGGTVVVRADGEGYGNGPGKAVWITLPL